MPNSSRKRIWARTETDRHFQRPQGSVHDAKGVFQSLEFRFPSVADALAAHDKIIRDTGGNLGVLHSGGVEAALDRARYGPFEGSGTLAERAALILRGIAQDHPFADGNKRTALALAESFLTANGFRFDASADDLVEFMLSVARIEVDLRGIEEWVDAHARKV